MTRQALIEWANAMMRKRDHSMSYWLGVADVADGLYKDEGCQNPDTDYLQEYCAGAERAKELLKVTDETAATL